MKHLSYCNKITLHSVDSTNDYILRNNELLLNDGIFVVADQQTNGKGQKGRKWESGLYSNLFMSFVQHINDNQSEIIGVFSPLMALAVVKTLLHYKISPHIIKVKWPNDVLVDYKKISGILTEVKIIDEHLIAIICGIGVNLYGYSNQFSDDIANKVNTLENVLSTQVDKEQFLTVLIGKINDIIDSLYQKKYYNQLKEWDKFCYKMDEPVKIKVGEEVIEGKVKGISHGGELILLKDNRLTYISTGDWLLENY